MLASNLLFAFSDHDDVHGKLFPRGEMRFERFHVQEELPFVVHRPARKDLSVTHRRLEGRRRPEVERLGRLNIVVAVDENRWSSRRVSPLADDDRVTGCRIDPRRYADLVE